MVLCFTEKAAVPSTHILPRTYASHVLTYADACMQNNLSLAYSIPLSFTQSVAIPWALALHNSSLTHCSSGLIHPSLLMDEQKSSPHTLLPHFLWLFQSETSISHLVYNSSLFTIIISGLRHCLMLSFMAVILALLI